MTKAVTVRLDEADHAALTRQADELKVPPGTLARMLVHAGLAENRFARAEAHTAVDRLIQRSRHRPMADAVDLVKDARAAIGERG